MGASTQHRKELKRAQYNRLLATLAEPADPRQVRDPLAEAPNAMSRAQGVLAALLGALAAHAAVLGGFYGAASVFGERSPAPEPAPIQLTVQEIVVQPPVAEIQPVEEPPVPEPQPKPRPKTRRRKRARSKAPPPDPVDLPPEPAAPAPKKVRTLAGISLDSTTQGGAGPVLQAGNSRMGRTGRVGEEAPKERAPKAASSNRKATRAPIGLGSASIQKPKFSGPRLEPEYPEAYRAQALKARITVEVLIGSSGEVKRVSFVTKPPNAAFRDAVLKVARRQRWKPARRDGRPIEYTLTYTYNFNYSTLKE